jgi:hypothetical protein
VLHGKRHLKWTLLLATGIVGGALVAAAVGSAFSSRQAGVVTEVFHFSGSLDEAGSRILFDDGEFRIIGKCVNLGGGTFRAQPVIKTTNDHSAFTSHNGDAADQDWNRSEPAKKIQNDATAAQGTAAAPDFAAHSEDSYFGTLKDGGNEVLQGFAWSSAFRGPKCRWGGTVTRMMEN